MDLLNHEENPLPRKRVFSFISGRVVYDEIISLVAAAIIALNLTGVVAVAPGAAAAAESANRSHVSEESDTRDAFRRYRDAEQTLLAAEACWGAYYPNVGIMNYLRASGWKLETVNKTTPRAAVHYVLGCRELDGGNFYLLAIRGSADMQDWRSNLATSQVPFGGRTREEARMWRECERELPSGFPKVHKGFCDYGDALLDDLLQSGLARELQMNGKTRLLLAGHSLGGAAATLLAERLMLLGVPWERMRVITFGAPAVGNVAFAEEYGSAVDLLRVTNAADPVPGSLQTLRGGYRQFGLHVRYKLSPRDNAMQHYMDLYLDRAAQAYFDAQDEAVAEGALFRPPGILRRNPKLPMVALYVTTDQVLEQRAYMPQLGRFALEALQRALPNYVILHEAHDAERDKPVRSAVDARRNHLLTGSFGELLPQARAAGADYAVAVHIGAHEPQDSGEWYLNVENTLWDVRAGRLESLETYAKRLSYYSGNLDTTAEALCAARTAMLERWEWLRGT